MTSECADGASTPGTSPVGRTGGSAPQRGVEEDAKQGTSLFLLVENQWGHALLQDHRARTAGVALFCHLGATSF